VAGGSLGGATMSAKMHAFADVVRRLSQKLRLSPQALQGGSSAGSGHGSSHGSAESLTELVSVMRRVQAQHSPRGAPAEKAVAGWLLLESSVGAAVHSLSPPSAGTADLGGAAHTAASAAQQLQLAYLSGEPHAAQQLAKGALVSLERQ